jgi:hypothetical protein
MTGNPMLVQFWLWGLDALSGDLSAKGFQKLHRPENTDSSVYALNGVHLHGHGMWLEANDELLVYRRPAQSWYALSARASVCVEHFSRSGLAWCDFARPRNVPTKVALEAVRDLVRAYEAFVASRRGADWRASQLQRVTSKPVRRARKAWRAWLEA